MLKILARMRRKVGKGNATKTEDLRERERIYSCKDFTFPNFIEMIRIPQDSEASVVI